MGLRQRAPHRTYLLDSAWIEAAKPLEQETTKIRSYAQAAASLIIHSASRQATDGHHEARDGRPAFPGSRAAFTPRDARESWPATSVAGHVTARAQADMKFRKLRGVIAVSLRKMFEKWL